MQGDQNEVSLTEKNPPPYHTCSHDMITRYSEKALSSSHRSMTIGLTTGKPKTLRPTRLRPTTGGPKTLRPTRLRPSTGGPKALRPITLRPTTLSPAALGPITMRLQAKRLKKTITKTMLEVVRTSRPTLRMNLYEMGGNDGFRALSLN